MTWVVVTRGGNDSPGPHSSVLLRLDDEPTFFALTDRLHEVRNDLTTCPFGMVVDQLVERLDVDSFREAEVVLKVSASPE